MNRKTCCFVLVALLVFFVIGCGNNGGQSSDISNQPSETTMESETEQVNEEAVQCQHIYSEATCTNSAECTICGVKNGIALGHDVKEADCTQESTCNRCGEKLGDKKGHSYVQATCTKAATCSVCGATDGNAKGHTYIEATCTKAATCKVCGITNGNAKGHTYIEATCTKAATCKVCGITNGNAKEHNFKDGICTVCGIKDSNYLKTCTYGDSFEIVYNDAFLRITIGQGYKFQELKKENTTKYAGKYIGFPVTVENIGNANNSAFFAFQNAELFSSNGVESEKISPFFDEWYRVEKTSLRPGASISGYIYLSDTGEGNYYINMKSRENGKTTGMVEIVLPVP